MSRNTLAQNHGAGGGTQAVSRMFYNSRDRSKYRGRQGELVADMCECADVDGNRTAKLYLHDGVTCGGIPVSAVACPLDICAELNKFPTLGLIEGINLPDTICDVLNEAPNIGNLIA